MSAAPRNADHQEFRQFRPAAVDENRRPVLGKEDRERDLVQPLVENPTMIVEPPSPEARPPDYPRNQLLHPGQAIDSRLKIALRIFRHSLDTQRDRAMIPRRPFPGNKICR